MKKAQESARKTKTQGPGRDNVLKEPHLVWRKHEHPLVLVCLHSIRASMRIPFLVAYQYVISHTVLGPRAACTRSVIVLDSEGIEEALVFGKQQLTCVIVSCRNTCSM